MSDLDLRFRFAKGTRQTLTKFLGAIISESIEGEKPDDDKIIDEVEKVMGDLPPIYRVGYVWLVRAIEMAPLAMGYGKQFSNLGLEDRMKVIDGFEHSTHYVQRGSMLAVKALLILLYFSEPEMDHALGYDHECLLHAAK